MTSPGYEHLLGNNEKTQELQGLGVFTVEEFIERNKDKVHEILKFEFKFRNEMQFFRKIKKGYTS